MAADSATALWLLRAPPWTDDYGGQWSTHKRARTDIERTRPRPSVAEDTLRKYAEAAAFKLGTVGGWHSFVARERGEPDIAITAESLDHRASRLLKHLRRRGAAVPMRTAPWTVERIRQAARRGSHKSARDDIEFVCREMLEFCTQGFWTVHPFRLAIQLPGLQLSPLGVVPQRNRRSRLIVDYTFSGVNGDTIRLAPPEAMQFCKALKRVLSKIVHANPKYGPFSLGKIDIADGFYRIGLLAQHIPRLGVILPTSSGDPLVAFPLALPMGWVESPPYFTSATETACDLTNVLLRQQVVLPPHPLESLAATPPPHETSSLESCVFGLPPINPPTHTPPLAYADVYVDDFILVAQTKRHRQRVLRAALHSIDQVFRPLTVDDRASRKEPISTKKLLQGDACWATQKTILGWDFDTDTGTLNLPRHRLDRLYDLLDAFPASRRRAPIREWNQLLGELRSMSAALPGSSGLFSILQDALGRGDRHRIRLSRKVFDTLADFRAIADTLRARPTRFTELIPKGEPVAIGACDASRQGMGGVWFTHDLPPIVWRAPFPPAIQAQLTTSENRTGSLSISDLELAGTLAHKHVLAIALPSIAERPIWLAGDNRASLAWATKGSSTSTAARAYLLRLNALHQRHYRYVPQHSFIAGKANVMADDASRRWDLTDSALIAHFNSLYPQNTSWTMQTLPDEMRYAAIGSLSRRRWIPATLRIAKHPPRVPGASGNVSALPSVVDPTCSTSLATLSRCSCSLPKGTALAPLSPATDPCALAQWKMPSGKWHRRSPGWGPLTLA